MQNELIAAKALCTHYQIEYNFIQSLHEAGLIEITSQSEQQYIEPAQLYELERFIRLHYDLDINLEGIEAITHLLTRMKDLQTELRQLRSKLDLYEHQTNREEFNEHLGR